MSATIKNINDARQTQVIECLKDMLEEAERGQLIGVAIAAVKRGRKVSTAYASGEGVGSMELSGAVAALAHRLATEWMDDQ